MRKSTLQNARGQLVVEMILLMAVTMGAMFFLIQGLKQMDFVRKMTAAPWVKLQGMIECGVWQPCGIDKKVSGLHPSTANRRLSLDNSSE